MATQAEPLSTEEISKPHTPPSNPSGIESPGSVYSYETRRRSLKRYNRLTKELTKLASESSKLPPSTRIAAYKAIGEYAIKPIIAEIKELAARRRVADKAKSSAAISLAIGNLPVGTAVNVALAVARNEEKPEILSIPALGESVRFSPTQASHELPPGEAPAEAPPTEIYIGDHPHFPVESNSVPAEVVPGAKVVPKPPVEVRSKGPFLSQRIRKLVDQAIENEEFNLKGRPYKVLPNGGKRLLPRIVEGRKVCWECGVPVHLNKVRCTKCALEVERARIARYKAEAVAAGGVTKKVRQYGGRGRRKSL